MQKKIYFLFFLLLMTSCTHGPLRGSSVCSQVNLDLTIEDSQKFSEIINCSELRGKIKVQNLVARVIKGKTDSDFETLTNDPIRKIVFLMGSDGLQDLIGLRHDEIFVKIGYTDEYVRRLKSEGYRFKLVVFRPQGDEGRLATWDNVATLAEKVYPRLALKIQESLPELKKTNFAQLQSAAGFKFSEVDRIGAADPRFIDEEKLETSPGHPWQVRAFLFNRVRLMDLYAGNGFAETAAGQQTLKEYIAPNLKIERLLDPTVIDL